MTKSSKMPSPKEALIRAKVCIENETATLFEKRSLEMIKAAIPVAELEHEAVPLAISCAKAVVMAGGRLCSSDRALLAQLEALRCSPPK